jgi:lysylphosphatidylglycerol synthetase-like protein (DUF2156 family)
MGTGCNDEKEIFSPLKILVLCVIVSIYTFFLAAYVHYLFYTKSLFLLSLWLFALLLNIGSIIINTRKKIKMFKYIIIEMILINFVFIALIFLFRAFNLFKRATAVDKLKMYLWSMLQVAITGNWLLLFLYYFRHKKYEKHKDARH